ncbi:hypothetical protein [Microbispora sp. KK1-11]|uniref:hypothetical protein n=1 Tax=Microbispora sp. KK1-11 TaxID=2053005 RepID=UPI0011581811|nr:hypothetical protein [Microbispora sp. KK1-11]
MGTETRIIPGAGRPNRVPSAARPATARVRMRPVTTPVTGTRARTWPGEIRFRGDGELVAVTRTYVI